MNVLILFDSLFNNLQCIDEHLRKHKDKYNQCFLYYKTTKTNSKTNHNNNKKKYIFKQPDFFKHFKAFPMNVTKLDTIEELKEKVHLIKKVCVFVSGKQNKTPLDELKNELNKIPLETIISSRVQSFVYFKELNKESIKVTCQKLGLVQDTKKVKKIQAEFNRIKKTSKNKNKKKIKKSQKEKNVKDKLLSKSLKKVVLLREEYE